MDQACYIVAIALLWVAVNVAYRLHLYKARSKPHNVELRYWLLLIVKRPYSARVSTKYGRNYTLICCIALYAIASIISFYTLVFTMYSGIFMRVRGTVVLIPGLNVTGADLAFFLLAVGIAVSLHEYLHARVALKAGIPVKAFGFVLALIFPAAFVEIDEERFRGASKAAKVGTLAAGVSANLALMGLSMLILSSIASPVGLLIVSIEEGSLAWASGLKQYDIVYSINNTQATLSALRDYLSVNRTVVLELEVYRPGVGYLNIPIVKDATVDRLGVYISQAPSKSVVNFVHPAVFLTLFRAMYWSYVVNYSLLFLNALPLFITDGGRIFSEVLGSKLGKVINTLVLIVLVISLLATLRI